MTVQQAERDAQELLASSWWDDFEDEAGQLPIDPMDIAERLGIAVRRDLLPTDESGNIVLRPSGEAVITLNFSDHPNRQRFTCAHEIGHYLRRRSRGIRRQTFTDYRDTLAGLGRDPEEIYANQFAAALLMPARLVQRGYRRGDDIDTLARRFGTSSQAMTVRLRNLGLIS